MLGRWIGRNSVSTLNNNPDASSGRASSTSPNVGPDTGSVKTTPDLRPARAHTLGPGTVVSSVSCAASRAGRLSGRARYAC